jgi:xylulokinase
MPAATCFLCADVDGDLLGLSLVDDQGQVIGHLDRNLAGRTGSSSDPQDWWRAMRTGTKDLLRRNKVPAAAIRGVGLSGSLQRVVCVADDGSASCPSANIDSATLERCNQAIVERCGAGNLSNITGQQAHGNTMAAHLLWVQEHAKRVWHDLAHALFPRDFLRFRLTDTAATDPSSAARSLLFNTRQQIWSKQLSSRLEIDINHLPQVLPGRQIGGRVSPNAAKETGLPAGTPVIMGGAHLAATAVALGVTQPGQVLIELGGCGSCLIVTGTHARPRGRHLESSCHCLADTATLEGRDLITDHGIDWLLREVTTGELQRSRRSKREPLDLLAELAAETAPGADGLLYIQPEDNLGHGAFIGLHHGHSHGHLVRAVLESGAITLHGLFRELDELGLPIEEVLLTGPGASNQLWCQIVTDAIGRKTRAVTAAHLPAIGTALMAAAATGCCKDLSTACKGLKLTKHSFTPRKSAMNTYAELHPVADRLTSGIAEVLDQDHTRA